MPRPLLSTASWADGRQAVVYLRRATLADADLLLRWRNDPQTVAMSRSASRVTPQEHAAWLAAVVTPSSASWLYVGVIYHRLPIGSVRLDLTPQAVTLSLVMAPRWRAQQLAWQLLELACSEVAHLNQRVLRAEIRRDNLASRRLFTRAGFRLVRLANHEQDWLEYRRGPD